MAIDLIMWADAQSLLASAFMVPAMVRIWRMQPDKWTTLALLALFFAVHAMGGMMMFGGLSVIAAIGPLPVIVPSQWAWLLYAAVWMTWVGTALAITVKSLIVWLGEERGRTKLFRAYVGISAAWAIAGVVW